MANVVDNLKNLRQRRNSNLLLFCQTGQFLLSEELSKSINMQIDWLEGCPSNNVSEDKTELSVRIVF